MSSPPSATPCSPSPSLIRQPVLTTDDNDAAPNQGEHLPITMKTNSGMSISAEEKAFAASTNACPEIQLDASGNALTHFGFSPGDRVCMQSCLGTVEGIDEFGRFRIRVDGKDELTILPWTTKEELTQHVGLRHATDADERFIASAVKFSSEQGEPIFLDVSLEAISAFGFRPEERVWARSDTGIVTGVDINGTLFFTMDSLYGVCSVPPEHAGSVRKLTAAEEAFFAIAEPFDAPVTSTMKDADPSAEYPRTVYLDMRRNGPMTSFGFQPGDLVTACDGLITAMGIDVKGRLCFFGSKQVPTYLRLSPPQVLTLQCRRATEADKAFFEIATLQQHVIPTYRFVIAIDTRPDSPAMKKNGLRLNEIIVLSCSYARIAGFDVFGALYVEIVGFRGVIGCGDLKFERVSEFEKRFVAIASCHELYDSDLRVLLDTRAEAIVPFGFRPGESIEGTHVPDPTYAVGVDNAGRLYFSRRSFHGKVFLTQISDQKRHGHNPPQLRFQLIHQPLPNNPKPPKILHVNLRGSERSFPPFTVEDVG